MEKEITERILAPSVYEWLFYKMFSEQKLNTYNIGKRLNVPECVVYNCICAEKPVDISEIARSRGIS